MTFDSRGESQRYLFLKSRLEAGEITNLERQCSYRLEVNGHKIADYRPDFRYRLEGVEVIEDFKSKATITPVFRLKSKMMKALHGIDVLIVLKPDTPVTSR